MDQRYSQFSPEETAYIYQQIEELRPFLSEKGIISVKEIETGLDFFTLQIGLWEGKEELITIESSGTSVIDAMKKGATEVKRYIDEINDEQVSHEERLAEINEALKTKH